MPATGVDETMTTPQITALPPAPTPQDSPEAFNDKAFRALAAQEAFVEEANELAEFVAQKAGDVSQDAHAASVSASTAADAQLAAENAASTAVAAKNTVQGAIDTLSGIDDELAATQEAAQEAKDIALAAISTAEEAGVTKYADTYADLLQKIGLGQVVNGDYVKVFADEENSGYSSIYAIEVGAPIFKRNVDQLRADLTTFSGAISATPEWSAVPAHEDSNLDAQTQAALNRIEKLKDDQQLKAGKFIEAEPSWGDVPKHKSDVFNAQAQALANRVEALRKGEMAQFQLSELGAAARLQSSKFSDFVNVRDFGATGDGHYHPLSERFSTLAMAQVAYPFATSLEQSIDWAAFQSAVKNSKGAAVYASAGEYVLTDELLITEACMQIFGQGKGYARNLLSYAPDLLAKTTCLTFVGTGKKSIKTRVSYRASSAAPSDDPISTAINIQNDGVTLQNLMVNLYCDYSDTSPTNYGADWDVGVFHGSRQDFRMIDVNVVGYWREASIWLDSTRGVNLPELNGYPSTFGAGADGTSLVRVQTIGGRWGLRKQGPRPKPGLLHFGFQYKRAAKFAFSSNPIAGDTLTVGSEVYTFQSSGTAIMGVKIGATVAVTIDALIEKLRQFRIVPYDELTFIRNGDSLEVYSISNTATPLSTTSASIAVQTISGGAATQTETISDPAKYYDDVAGLVDDGRNSLGASDFVLDNCVICSVEHHSKYRMTDKSDVTDFEESKSSGAIWIDGIGGNAMMHRQFAHHTRFQSVEPFCVRIGFAGRVRFLDCTQDSAVGSWRSTTGAALTSSDTFGKIAASPVRSAMIQVAGYDDPGEYFPINKNRNQIYSHFYMQGFDVRANRDLWVGRNAVIGETNSGNTTGFAEIKSGASANTEVRFSTEAVSSVARLRASSNGGFTLSLRPSGTGAITDALFVSSASFQVYSAPRPSQDNEISCGTADRRFSVYYGGTGTINLSDEREKTPLRSITEAERAAALEIKASIGAYQWLDAIAQKGEAGARIHWGVGAQTVGEILRSHGLDPTKYAFWCYDEWSNEYESVKATRLVPDLDDRGMPCEREEEYETGEVQLVRAAGNRYGIRLDQLLAFVLAAL